MVGLHVLFGLLPIIYISQLLSAVSISLVGQHHTHYALVLGNNFGTHTYTRNQIKGPIIILLPIALFSWTRLNCGDALLGLALRVFDAPRNFNDRRELIQYYWGTGDGAVAAAAALAASRDIDNFQRNNRIVANECFLFAADGALKPIRVTCVCNVCNCHRDDRNCGVRRRAVYVMRSTSFMINIIKGLFFWPSSHRVCRLIAPRPTLLCRCVCMWLG